MRVLPLLICLALSACATPRWVNPKNPDADVQADLTACEKDALRATRLERDIAQPANCSGAHCIAQEQQQKLQATAAAVAAQNRCMAARGWRQG